MNFEEWFGNRLPPNYKPLLNDAWQAAVEATKAACVEAVKNIQSPYPEGVSSITNDDEYAVVIKNPTVRTAVSWYLAGRSFGLYQYEAIQAIRETEML